VARNLFKAFEEARRISVERALAAPARCCRCRGLRVVKRMQRGRDDLMPYGVEQNRTTLEAFLQYAFEQGVCHPQADAEELFPASVQKSFKV